ncbi:MULTISPECIES: non-ribosomal peptide synthetase [Cysteiniphilum]|uniref:non-ribosomal peptide synthetase n=1 Tax=Cysteiniphilum TaxID=2056696 RepID=UPI001785ACC9|nr:MULTISPECIES: non-ribosomal peptide synthetase [Cysteiniphilum]
MIDSKENQGLVATRRVIHELFERQVEKTPTSQALIFGNQSVSYEILNSRSNQLARKIRVHYEAQVGKGFSKGVLIPLYLDRSFEMVIATLAVLKLGGAYVPIDPTFPDERVRYILKDTNAKVVVTQSWYKENLKKLGYEDAAVQADEIHEIESYSKQNLDVDTNGDDIAYVIYTSGTTGNPKGVMVPHKGVVNRIQWMQKQYPLGNQDRVLQKTPYSFDVSVWELIWANWYGAAIVIAKPEGHKDVDYLHQLITTEQVTIVHFVPSMLSVFLDFLVHKTLSKYVLRRVFCSGEALSDSIKDRFYEVFEHRFAISLHNLYGPTEASIDVSFHDCAKDKKVTIGKAIDNMALYVLDSQRNQCAPNEIGELYLSGVGLARGYLNLPKLSEAAFIKNPFADQTNKVLGYDRLYKTGDLVRQLDNGDIEYLGRNDSQVKIRGFRIELSEIEQVLCQFKGVKQCCVIVKDQANAAGAQKMLVGYYTTVDGLDIDDAVLLTHLQSMLPEYMVPSFLMQLASFPLTANGKLDKNALPDVNIDSTAYVPPSTEIESKVCQIWQGALGVDKVGVTDNFLQLGGNSILAIDVVMRMKQFVGYHFNALDLIKGKNIKTLLSSAYVDNHDDQQQLSSQAQMHLSDLHHFEKSILSHVLATNTPLIYNESFTIEYVERVNFKVFKVAVDYLMTKYELLHSAYYEEKEAGTFHRHLNYDHPVVCQHVKLNEKNTLELFCKQIDQTPFDIEKDKLIRFYLVDDVDAKQYVFISFFHALLDATSLINIVLPDLYLCLQEDKRSLVKQSMMEFTTLSMSLNERYQRNMQQKIKYWQQKFDHCQALDLGFSKTTEDVKGQQLSCDWGAQVRQQVKSVANALKISEYSVLYGLFTLMLAKTSQQSDFAVITNVDERMYVPQHQSVIGCFINNVIIDANVTQDNTLKEHLVNTHQKVIESIEQVLPYDRLLEVDRDKVLQLSDVQFNLETNEIYHYPYRQTQNNSHSGYVKHGLYFELDLKQDHLLCRVEFKFARYPLYFVESLLNSYSVLLERLEGALGHKVSEISLLSAKDYQKVVYDWNRTEVPFPKDKTIYQLFEEQVAKTPNNIAIVFEGNELTYQELNARSNQLANYIRASFLLKTGSELMPDTLIALCLERSLEMIISIIAVLKAGAAYVPIAPSLPHQRIVYMLTDTESQLLLVQSMIYKQLTFLTESQLDLYYVFVDQNDCYQGAEENLLPYSKPENLAYVIYTSGTTGVPKGVMQEHNNVVELFRTASDYFSFGQSDHWMMFHDYIFDFSVWELWGALSHGGMLVLPSRRQLLDMNEIFRLCNAYEVSVFNQTPAVFLQFQGFLNFLPEARSCLKKFRYIILGGDRLTPDKLSQWWTFCAIQGVVSPKIINMYGITEATIHVSYKEMSYDESEVNSLIGKSLADMQIYILDKYMNPLPVGAIGEIYVSGERLSRGYLNLPDLTNKNFVKNPFYNGALIADGRFDRMYRTGDLARWLPNGELIYIGRIDSQIKIRGYRIELDEIERRLALISGIEQCCVVAKEDRQAEYYICGYYVLGKDKMNCLTKDAIHKELRSFLPDYMMPSSLIQLEGLPLTINGKLDCSALPEPTLVATQQCIVEPISNTEKELCELWQSVLDIELVGMQDDFFDLGGNSVLAITIAYRMSKILQSEIRVADIFRLKTISAIIEDCTLNAGQQHIKVLSETKKSDYVLCFVHPAFAGCEVYQTLVDKFSSAYLCIGIENYNFEHDNKIATLSEIAQQYLCYLKLSPNVKDTHQLTLVGWSLGGLIALEMAYWLEQQGRTNVRLILLDSHIPYGRALKYHPHFDPEKGGQKVDDFINEKVADLEPCYAQKVLMNKDYDIAIGKCRPTGKLRHTTTVLFKATKQIGYNLRHNNVGKYVKSLKLVKIEANHMNIIDEINNDWSKHEAEFSYKRTKFTFKLQDWINKIKREIPTLIFVLGAVAVAAYLISVDSI